jgi:NAD-dependent dihydropyrimidine dehydrogenase PreA subunit
MAFRVSVDEEKCKGCEECAEVCTVKVFEMRGGKSVPAHDEKCIGCESCREVCEENAIQVAALQADLSETVRSLLRDIL